MSHAGAEQLPGAAAAAHEARRWVVAAVVVLVLLAVATVVLLTWHRRRGESRQRAANQRGAALGRVVSVTSVGRSPASRLVTLPGDVHGFDQATLYAKVSGYVREVRVERGDRVRRGQVLAVLESPENERDVESARHDLLVMKENAQRAQKLAPAGVVAVQDRDNALAQARIAQANLSRALDILGYTVMRAPFDGVVTARYLDPGALVPAATGGTQSALPVVDVTDVDWLRVFVYVGQDVAPFVHPADAVTIWQDELPDRRIAATITRTAGGLDPRTRTMQLEVDLDNRGWHLLPGTFVHVELHVSEPPSPLIPDEAIVVRDGKTMVVTVAEHRAHYVPVDLGYNDGRQVRVLRGLAGSETIGIDVPVEVEDGSVVQPRPSSGTGPNESQP